MKRKRFKFVSNIALPFVMLFLLIIFLFGLWFIYFSGVLNKPEELYLDIIIIGMIGVIPSLIFIWLAIVYWKVFELSEEGIKKSFMGIRLKLIKWDEIKDIRIVPLFTGGAWMRFYKINLNNLAPSKFVDKKGEIDIIFSKRLYDAVKLFSDTLILNVNGEEIHINGDEGIG